MWHKSSALEVYYSPLPPDELLQRLAYRVATVVANTNGWGTTRRSQPFHEFEGVISGNHFAISQLPNEERRARTFTASLLVQSPQVEGWLVPGPAGGTLVQLHFHALLLPWWSVVVMLLLFAWSKYIKLETWPTFAQLGQLLAETSVIALGALLARPLSLWLRQYQLRPALTELFQLTAPATA